MRANQQLPGAILASGGALLQVPGIIAVLRVFSAMRVALPTLASSGIGDPTRLVGAFEEFLDGSTVGLVLGLVGLLMLSIALVQLRCRARWLRWFCSVYSIPLLLVLPVGTAFALFFLFYIGKHRWEFTAT